MGAGATRRVCSSHSRWVGGQQMPAAGRTGVTLAFGAFPKCCGASGAGGYRQKRPHSEGHGRPQPGASPCPSPIPTGLLQPTRLCFAIPPPQALLQQGARPSGHLGAPTSHGGSRTHGTHMAAAPPTHPQHAWEGKTSLPNTPQSLKSHWERGWGATSPQFGWHRARGHHRVPVPGTHLWE